MRERVPSETCREIIDHPKDWSQTENWLARDLLDARLALGWYFVYGCIHGPVPAEMQPAVDAGFAAYKASLELRVLAPEFATPKGIRSGAGSSWRPLPPRRCPESREQQHRDITRSDGAGKTRGAR
jgi:hypothetical protein